MDGFFDSCCLKIDGIPFPLPREVPDYLSQGAILVDLRSDLETEIKAFGVERIIYLPHVEFEEKWQTLPLDKPLILADAVGIWSKHFAQFLIVKGHSATTDTLLQIFKSRFATLNGMVRLMILFRRWLNKSMSHTSSNFQIASLAGGIADWEKDGMPLKAGKYQPLSGPCPCMIVPKERK